jgi:hypothetical protein
VGGGGSIEKEEKKRGRTQNKIKKVRRKIESKKTKIVTELVPGT